MYCEGAGGHVAINMGRLVVLNVLGATAGIGGVTYSTGPERGEGRPFVVGQDFAEGDNLMIDFVDPNVVEILVSLRVQWDATDQQWSGTLYNEVDRVEVSCVAG